MSVFDLDEPVIYLGKTYSFPGFVTAKTLDGQYVVQAFGSAEGYYKGMKHLYGPSQLEPFAASKPGDLPSRVTYRPGYVLPVNVGTAIKDTGKLGELERALLAWIERQSMHNSTEVYYAAMAYFGKN